MFEPAAIPADDRGQRRRRTRRRVRRVALVITPLLALSGILVSLNTSDDEPASTQDETTSTESDATR